MPKLNRYRSLHTTVIGPEGRPLEIQVRTREMHEDGRVRRRRALALQARQAPAKARRRVARRGCSQLMDWQARRAATRASSCETLRTDLFDDEVYVFTPKGEVKTLPAGATPIDFAYAVHTDVGHRTRRREGERPDRAAPLPAEERRLRRDPDRRSRAAGPSRDWLALAASSRARNKIRQWFQRETPRRDRARRAATSLDQALKAQNLPYREARRARACSPQVIREIGLQEGGGLLHRARLGQARRRPDRQQGHAAAEDRARSPRSRSSRSKPPQARKRTVASDVARHQRPRRRGRARAAREVLHAGAGRRDRRLHLARPRDHDPPRGLPERQGADAEPGALHAGRVGRAARRRASASRSRSTPGTAPRLLEDVARTFAEHGANIVAYGGTVEDRMARNWYTAEVGDVKDAALAADRAAQPRGRLRRLPR